MTVALQVQQYEERAEDGWFDGVTEGDELTVGDMPAAIEALRNLCNTAWSQHTLMFN